MRERGERRREQTYLVEAPLAHNEGIVHGEAVDLVNAARLDFLVLGLVPGKVRRRAGGGEGAWRRTHASAMMPCSKQQKNTPGPDCTRRPVSQSRSQSCDAVGPGRAKTTARLPLKRSLVVTSFQAKGLSPPTFSSRTRHLKVTCTDRRVRKEGRRSGADFSANCTVVVSNVEHDNMPVSVSCGSSSMQQND